MDAKLIKQYGDELYHAMQSKQAVAPLTARESDISIEDAYHISLQMLNRRIDAGAKVIGKKIGVTNNLEERVTRQQGYTEDEYEILDMSDDISYISHREIELQKLFGYRVDQKLYKDLNPLKQELNSMNIKIE